MSKVDAMRALREARHAAAAKAAPVAPPRASTQARPAPRKEAAAKAEAAEGLCGHRNMGGKSCTREADHVQSGTKNHRYG
jgi:uncharacterized low-complexity protein